MQRSRDRLILSKKYCHGGCPRKKGTGWRFPDNMDSSQQRSFTPSTHSRVGYCGADELRTIRKFRVGLLEQLEQLETEQYQVALSIVEVHRRLYTLARVKSWSLPGGRLRSYSDEATGKKLVSGLTAKLTNTKVELIEGYCLKCKSKSGIKDASRMTMKNGRPRAHGFCVVCNTRMSTITMAQ